MSQNNWEMDFEYDWVTKKRQKDQMAQLKLNPSVTTAQISKPKGNSPRKSYKSQLDNKT